MFCLIKDGLMRLGLDISGLHGQGYDGGSNMAGKINGLQQKMLRKIRKRYIFIALAISLTWFARTLAPNIVKYHPR